MDEVVDVANVGDVADGDGLVGEQRGTDDLQRLILGTLRRDGAAEQMSAFYLECCHLLLLFLFILAFCFCRLHAVELEH